MNIVLDRHHLPAKPMMIVLLGILQKCACTENNIFKRVGPRRLVECPASADSMMFDDDYPFLYQ